MKDIRRQKKAAQTQERARTEKKSFLKSEWPLLLYPALVLTALVVLYAVNRSIQQERASSDLPELKKTDPPQTADAHETPQPEPAPKTSVPSDRSTPHRDPDQHRPAPPKPTPAQQQETRTLLAKLGQALDAQDDATIKQSMKDLVALGDEAVGSLGEMVTAGDSDTAVWAAKALARIGTPSATSMLLTAMEEIEEGPLKEQLAKQVSSITNHDSWPVLMDAFVQGQDATIQRAASVSLADMADPAIVDEIVLMYDSATTDAEATRLAQLVSHISSPKASESLLTLAGDVSSKPQNSLQEASIAALANIGDARCVSYLLQKLEASSPGQGSSLFTAITRIDQPQAQSALLYAAAGNKEVSAEQGRAAAIYALGNYPNTETYSLLQKIAADESNAVVLSAAVRTLDRIEQSTPALAQAATSKADSLR